MKKKEEGNISKIGGFLLAIYFIAGGLIMLRDDLVAFSVNSRTLSPSGFGGHLLILVGLIFLVVAYFSLSPFGKIRRFFEGDERKGPDKRKKTK